MARLMVFLMIAVAIMVLFNYAGLQTTTGYILGQLGILDSPQNFNSTGFYVAIAAALAALIGTSTLRIGTFGFSPADTAVSAALALPLAALIGDFVSVLIYVRAACPADSFCNWISYLVGFIMAIIIVGYTISLYDWARHSDA